MRDRISAITRSNITPDQILSAQTDAEIIVSSTINIDSIQSGKITVPILERTTSHGHGTVTSPSSVNYNGSLTADRTTVVKRFSGNPARRGQIYLPSIGKATRSDASGIIQNTRIGECTYRNSTGIIQIPVIFNGIRIEIHTGTDIDIVTETNHHIAKSVRGADVISVSFNFPR